MVKLRLNLQTNLSNLREPRHILFSCTEGIEDNMAKTQTFKVYVMKEILGKYTKSGVLEIGIINLSVDGFELNEESGPIFELKVDMSKLKNRVVEVEEFFPPTREIKEIFSEYLDDKNVNKKSDNSNNLTEMFTQGIATAQMNLLKIADLKPHIGKYFRLIHDGVKKITILQNDTVRVLIPVQLTCIQGLNFDEKKNREYEIKLISYDADSLCYNIEFKKPNQSEEMNQLIEKGIEKGLDKELVHYLIHDVMTGRYHFPKELILDVINTWKIYPETVAYEIPDARKVRFVETNGEVYNSIALIIDGKANLRYAGIQSTGKTTLVEQVAAILQRPLLTITGCEETSVEDFNGDFTITPRILESKSIQEALEEIKKVANENSITLDSSKALQVAANCGKPEVIQQIEFQKWYMVIAMQLGCILHIDEVDQIRKNILIKQHAALDGRRSISIRGIGTVIADDNFTVMSTMNGTIEMLESTESRFVTMALNPPKSIENILKDRCKNATSDEINKVNGLYKILLSSYESGEIIGAFVSIRSLINALNHKKYFNLKQSIILNVANISWNDKDSLDKVNDLINIIFI